MTFSYALTSDRKTQENSRKIFVDKIGRGSIIKIAGSKKTWFFLCLEIGVLSREETNKVKTMFSPAPGSDAFLFPNERR